MSICLPPAQVGTNDEVLRLHRGSDDWATLKFGGLDVFNSFPYRIKNKLDGSSISLSNYFAFGK